MSDQLSSLGELLDNGINVLVYHGIMDMLLPASGMAKALDNIPWSGQTQWWNETAKKPYWKVDAETKRSELMGYRQQHKGLTFVTVRNAGHMVPRNQPRWSLQILQDFIASSCLENEDEIL